MPAWSLPDKPREVIASTPSAYTGLTVPLPLPARRRGVRGRDPVRHRRARSPASARPRPRARPAPALEVVARGLRARASTATTTRRRARVAGRLDRHAAARRAARAAGARGVRRRSACATSATAPIDLVGSAGRPRVLAPDGARSTASRRRPSCSCGSWSAGEQQPALARRADHRRTPSTLRPFGAWWWWLLALALVALAPLGVVARDALGAGGRRRRWLARARAPMAGWPSERLRAPARRRSRAGRSWPRSARSRVAVVRLLGRQHARVPERRGPVRLPLALAAERLPGLAVELRRLRARAAAARGVAARDPVGAVRLAVVADRRPRCSTRSRSSRPRSRSTCSARGLGLRPQWAALPAAVSVVVPWAVVTTAFLTENVAYPACMWAVWAIWRDDRGAERRGATCSRSSCSSSPARARSGAAAARAGAAARACSSPACAAAPAALRRGCGRCCASTSCCGWRSPSACPAARARRARRDRGRRARAAARRRLRHAASASTLWTLLEKMGRLLLAGRRSAPGSSPAAIALPWLVVAARRARATRARFAFAPVVVLAARWRCSTRSTPPGPDER